MDRLSFSPIFGSWLVVELLVLILLGIFWYFSPAFDSLSKTRVRILSGLRVLFILLLGLVMLRPSLVIPESRQLPATLVMMVDQSESMSVSDESGASSRFDQMKKMLAESQASLSEIQNDFDLQVVGIDETVEPLEISEKGIVLPEEPTGSQTMLGAALLTVLQQNSGKRVPGVLLFSDGTQRTRLPEEVLPQDAAIRFRDAHLPIYPVCFGQTGRVASVQDISVRDLIVNDRVFVNNELTVSGQIRLCGFAGQTVPVQFCFETAPGQLTPVASLELTAETEDQTLPYRFVYVPSEPGQWKLQVVVPPQAQERVATNNELSSFVRVVDGGLNVLYFEGTRRIEQKFLRMALDSSADIHVDYWRPTPDSSLKIRSANAQDSQKTGFSSPSIQTEAAQIALATDNRSSFVNSKEDFFKPGKYAAYLLGDIDVTAFKKDELEALNALVANGTGLIFLTGERSLSTGGYADSPLAELAPIPLRQSCRLPLESDFSTFDATFASGQKLRREENFVIQPTESGRNHFLMRLILEPQKNLALWQSLPPLDRIYALDPPKPGAQVLAEAVPTDVETGTVQVGTTQNAESMPFLITQTFGSGRVVVVAADSTWKWWMNGFEKEHKTFWRQLIFWAAKMDELPEGELRIDLDRARFSVEEAVDFRVVYQPKEGENLERLQGVATVITPDGAEKEIPLTFENGMWSGSFPATDQAGDYRLKASILNRDSGNLLQNAQSRFLVYSENLELDHPEASPSVLENIALTSGGKVVAPADFPKLLQELSQKKERFVETREVRKTLYDSWFALGILVALLTAEWVLRKRWGLV